jgi:hypothetical protein
MSKIGLTLIAILIFAAAAPSLAQSTVPIEPLLRNHDPRLVALGAWEAGYRGNDTEISILKDKVERWDPAQRHRFQDGERFDAMTVILDTLIQRGEVVTPAGVTAIAYAFPDQALILATRLPFDDAEPILLSWYESGESVSRAHPDAEGVNRLMMARVAAMILSKRNPQAIAARLLADSVERLAVSVPNDVSNGLDRCLVGCETKAPCLTEFSDPAPVGWPHIFQYTLEENKPQADNAGPLVNGPLLIEAGGDRITYRRVEAETHLNYCYYPTPLTAETRHRLLAQMLGVDDKQMPWAVQMNLTLPWVNDEQFLLELTEQVNAEESRLRTTVKTFYAKGLITSGQVDSIRPKLSVVVFDDRAQTVPANPSLPTLPVKDSRTTYRISSWR